MCIVSTDSAAAPPAPKTTNAVRAVATAQPAHTEILRIALLLDLIPTFPLCFIFGVNQIDLILIVSFPSTRQLPFSNFCSDLSAQLFGRNQCRIRPRDGRRIRAFRASRSHSEKKYRAMRAALTIKVLLSTIINPTVAN
jgi:hypothetical protein